MSKTEKPLAMRDLLTQAEKILDDEARIGLGTPPPKIPHGLPVREKQSKLLERIADLGNQTNMAYAAAAESDDFSSTFLAEHTGNLICSVLEIVGINPLHLTLQQRSEIARKLAELGIKEPTDMIDKKIEGYLT